MQRDGSPDVKQVGLTADSPQGITKPALVLDGWELGWAVLISGPVEEVELVVAALEEVAVVVAGIAQWTEG